MRSLTQGSVRSVAALILILAALGQATTARADSACFGETGECIGDPFGTFWSSNGGLPVFGYPIGTTVPETNADTGQVYLTQWLERERLELHPEAPPAYRIALGRLGVERLVQQGRDWTTFSKASPTAAHYYRITGHAIAPPFWDYWRGHGLELGDPGLSERESLALWGYPLSEAAIETNSSGDRVLTQWFERARFEFHPDKPAPYRVLLGLLGREVAPTGNPPTSPRYEDRTDVTQTLLSYYNAVNRQEYERAYSYWETPGSGPHTTPPDFATFVQGYADTAYVAVTVGTPAIDAGAGNVWASVPVVLRATTRGGAIQMFAGCYVLHHTNPGIDPRPDAALWKLNRAAIGAAASSATPASLLSSLDCNPANIPPAP